jgi:ABC-2 type transport system permease protein
MKKVVDIALKDTLLSFRSRTALMFMFVMPVLIPVLFYFMFGTIFAEEEEFTLPQIQVVVVNLDEGGFPAGFGSNLDLGFAVGPDLNSMGALLLAILQEDTFADLMIVTTAGDAAAARQMVDNQEAGVALIFPADLTAALSGGDERPEIELYQDPTLTIGPAIVAGVVNGIIDNFTAGTIGVGVSLDQLAAEGATIDPLLVEEVVAEVTGSLSAEGAAQTPLLIVESPDKAPPANPFAAFLALILGGMLVFYAFLSGASIVQTVLTEEENGTLQRLFTTPTSRSTILIGKFLAAIIVIVVQVTVLLAFGALVFGIDWGDPPAVALASVGIVLISSCAGLFVVSLLKHSRQAGILFGGLLTITGLIGLFPVFTGGTPTRSPYIEPISLTMPQGWAMRGLRQALEGASLTDIALTQLVLLGWCAVFLAIGLYRFNRRFA